MITCIAVRMKSTRCPEKAMADLHGKPLIHRLIDRIHGVTHRTCLCTSTNPQDDVLSVQDSRVRVIRGGELNVAQRFLEAASRYNSEHIVRVTGDNPLTDPELMARMLDTHIEEGSDYTFCLDAPKGTKSEIIRTEALKYLYEMYDPLASEYMTHDLMTLENKLEIVTGFDRPDVRLTVDTPEDLKRVQCCYADFYGYPPNIEGLIEWYDDYEKQSKIVRFISHALH